jgi:MSHA biogenesis protein MshM
MLGTLGWLALRSPPGEVTSFVASKPIEVNTTVPVSVSMPASTYPANIAEMAPSISSSISERVPAATALPESVAPVPPSTQGNPARVEQQNAKSNIAGVRLAEYALLEQRVEETRNIIASTDAGFFTVQLFTTNNVQPDRMERFLTRARGLIDLSNLYVHPVKDSEQAKFRVTYGIYSSRDEATTALAGLPSKYQNDFQLELFTLGELR